MTSLFVGPGMGVPLGNMSVILGGMGRGEKMSTPPVLVSSPSDGVGRAGYAPGAGVMWKTSGKGVVLEGTAPSSSPAEG